MQFAVAESRAFPSPAILIPVALRDLAYLRAFEITHLCRVAKHSVVFQYGFPFIQDIPLGILLIKCLYLYFGASGSLVNGSENLTVVKIRIVCTIY